MSDPTAQPTIIEKLETFGHEALDAIEHGAVWLVGMCATAETSLHNLIGSSSLVQAAIAAGEASATAHGIPVLAIENAGEAILAAAKSFAAGLAQPAPTTKETP